jgi:YD repeat-containing protein
MKNNDLIGEFQFNNSMQLISYKNDGQIRYLSYDSSGNVVSVATEDGIYVEYLDYDTSKANPLNLINSITILRIDYKPHFKNVFKTEKAYPYKGDDFSVPLSFYKYSWTINSKGLIESMIDEKTLIYKSKFEYN